jgi:hypothetical protein
VPVVSGNVGAVFSGGQLASSLSLAAVDKAIDYEGGPVGQLIRFNDPNADFRGGFSYSGTPGGDCATSWEWTSNGHGQASLSVLDDLDDGAFVANTITGLMMTVRTGGTGALLTVSLGTQAVFEVRADGTLHGQTGKALTFDL